MKFLITHSILLFLAFPLQIAAHGGGQTVQKESGVYRITLDAVSPQLSSGVAERINFELERSDGVSPVPFSHAWVRIMGPKEGFLFAGNIHAAPEGFVTGISYLFSNEGTYTVTIRFFDGEHMLAEAELPVVIAAEALEESLAGEWWPLVTIFIAGILLGGLLRSVQLKQAQRN